MIFNKMGKYCVIIALLAFFMPLSLWAQNVKVSGVVTDSSNEPVIGASVSVRNSSLGTFTGLDGSYTLQAPSDATLEFKYLGYATKAEKVNGRTTINVVMDIDATALEDVVVVGYGTQKRGSITGAVAAIKSSEILQTKNENPQNMLTGKVPGVRVWQKSSEPGSYNNNFDIRGLGGSLVVIDGIPRSMSEFQRMNAQDIEDVSVLKDGAAAVYGLRSANGVLLVTTKKGGNEGKAKISYNGSYTFQKPSGLPTLADPFETMTLYNEKAKSISNDGQIITPIYGEDKFQAYADGTLRSADWNSLVFSDVSPQTQHDLSISGGNAKTQYYFSLGYFSQEGFFKSGDLNYDKYNLRSNLTTELLKGLSLNLNLSGMADQRNSPYSSSSDIIRNLWRQGVLFPAYADAENTMLSYEGLDLQENTVAKMTSDVSGYRKNSEKDFLSSASLTYDVGTIVPALKGLSAKLTGNFDYKLYNNSVYRKEYYLYAYDQLSDSYLEKLYTESSPSQLRREFYSNQQLLGQFLLNYDRVFDEVHHVSGVLGHEYQKTKGDTFFAQRDLAFSTPYLFNGVTDDQVGNSDKGGIYEYAYSSIIGKANYAYADRYLLELQFRYDGSSKFAEGHRWGFFPSASVGWRVSEEPFVKSNPSLAFINQLKLRASYGELGDDSGVNYEWIMGYNYPTTSGNAEKGYYNQYVPGYIFGGSFIYGATPMAIPNTNVSWYTSRMLNLGADFEGWDGLFGFSLDYFDRRRSGLFARRSGDLPTVVGATAPQENVNSDRQFGLELELTHRNKISDFSYQVKGIATITRNEYLVAVQNGPYANSYDQWRNDNLNNRYQGVQFGYESAGRYQDWNDIWTYPIYKERDVLPGDYKYVDWNGDGEINSLDEHPYAYDQTPWMNYSLSFSGQYKNFDLSFLLQGSALGSMQYQEPLYSIWGSNGGGTLVQYLDRWYPVDPSADLYDPATEWVSGYYAYTGRYPIGNSEFNRVSTAYLRLKSVEIGYTVPNIKALSSMRLRVFANAYNIFTITGVKFVDPEHPEDDLGRLYPLNKTYTLGLSLSF
jgi:TonB-linked SusC/RagA family outer membrane protein